ncbi:MAG: nitrous oxide reductase accessory protein NosL, partial [Fulvivirga sp.]|uniref:nitrous oxide reductase accessory protein NosL n=1 Tax=Fulvivirga sp. TaxID=1931237 RepID=UPI0032F0145E
MRLILYSISFFALLVSACNIGPQPISYSQDACDFCRMTIVDKQHAAQIVTVKGRNYKYDAIECMVNDLKEWDRPEADLILVADYTNPGELIEAQDANYLISKEIPSPMGAFLSAFSDSNELVLTQEESGGDTFNWQELKQKFSKQ